MVPISDAAFFLLLMLKMLLAKVQLGHMITCVNALQAGRAIFEESIGHAFC